MVVKFRGSEGTGGVDDAVMLDELKGALCGTMEVAAV